MANRIGRGIDVYISANRPAALSDEAGKLFDEYMNTVACLLKLTKQMSRHQGLDIECEAFNEMESCYYVQTKYIGNCTWEVSDQMAQMMGGEEEKNIEKLEPIVWIAPTRSKEMKEIDEAIDKLLNT